jgi:hypothetical protein
MARHQTFQPFAPLPPTVHRSPRFLASVPPLPAPAPKLLPPAAVPTTTDYLPRSCIMTAKSLSYPHNELTDHTGPPTADTLRVTHDELIAITSAMATSLGGGQQGHSSLVYSATDYAALMPTPAGYVVPALPVYPTPATLAATVAADANMTPTIQFMMYKHKMSTIDKANHVETDMRSMLLASLLAN